MPGSTARALELLETLQSSGLRTVGERATRLGVDERTVRRHLERLRDIGVPVESVRGRHGGYRIAPGHRMPPLMLDAAEATAVLLAIVAARAAGPGAADPAALETALAKLRRALPAALTARADALLEVATVDGVRAAVTIDPAILLTAADGIRDRRPLALVYGTDERATRRTLQPHDLVAYRGRWYLVGLDSSSGEPRAFRLDRIRSLRALGGTFPEPAPHDALAELIARFAGADYRWTVRLRVRSTPDHLERHLPSSVATVEGSRRDGEGGDPWLSVVIRAESLDWLPAVLLALDRPVIVDEPAELREQLRAAAERLGAVGS